MSPLQNYPIVALGGGTGLPLVLRCLVKLGFAPQAIVTMADDGGSSGVLRRELGMVPPGDVRNCLVALANEEERFLAEVFSYRFREGQGLEGHALGNLILAALNDLAGGFEYAVKLMERHLQVRGRVLPSTYDDVVLHALDRSGVRIAGQATVAVNPVAISRVQLVPSSVRANPEAVDAIRGANTVIIGPGSLYTSIVPNLLVPDILTALNETDARIIYLCNVANMRGETTGLNARDHVEALLSHGLKRVDLMVVNDAIQEEESALPADYALVTCDSEDEAALVQSQIEVARFGLVEQANPLRHSEELLCDALWEVLGDVVYR